jgi:hypothetical protein
MPNLPKFTLTFDERKDKWDLENDRTNRVVRTFPTKAKATAGGALRRAVGPAGGSVKIQKRNGRFQEERTYPRSKDPSKSPG